jgi:hypothetical protein
MEFDVFHSYLAADMVPAAKPSQLPNCASLAAAGLLGSARSPARS